MPIQPIPADALPQAETWAEVRARGHVMRYRRVGSGRTIVAFGSPTHPQPIWSELLQVLGASFRLILPEPPATDDDVPCWLSGFLEGLGVSNVRLLAIGDLSLPVLQLAVVEGDRIAGVVLMTEGRGWRVEGGGVLERTLEQMTVPLLVIDGSQPADEIVPLVTGFLGAG